MLHVSQGPILSITVSTDTEVGLPTTKSLVNNFVSSGLRKELEILGNELKCHRSGEMGGKAPIVNDESRSWMWTDKAYPQLIA